MLCVAHLPIVAETSRYLNVFERFLGYYGGPVRTPEPSRPTAPQPVPEETSDDRAPLILLVLILAIAVLAISSSAVLILWADAPAVSVTFWRTLGGALILAPAAVRSAVRGRSLSEGRSTSQGRAGDGATDRPTRRQWLIIAVSGIALGTHFATWLTSLELTSVAASVTLVSTVPIFIALWFMITGRPPSRGTWLAIGLAIVGTAVITIGDGATQSETVDANTSTNPLVGDALALIGAATMAVYLMLGDRLRSTLSTAAYASRTYAFAALSVLVFALISDTELTGYPTATWVAIGAMVLGPQLAGHTALNYLLRRLGSVSVSLSLLVEPIGAATLVWLIFDEVPPVTALLGGPLVIAAVAFQILIQARSNGVDAEPAKTQGASNV